MKALKSLALAGLMMALALTPSNALTIEHDEGGVIVDYIKQYSDIRDSGESVIINGECVSACTLVLGIVPKHKVCVTPNAVMGFHSASVRVPIFGKNKKLVGFSYAHAQEFSAMMWNLYPGVVRDKLKVLGWNGDRPQEPHPDIVWISDDNLLQLVRPCQPGDLS